MTEELKSPFKKVEEFRSPFVKAEEVIDKSKMKYLVLMYLTVDDVEEATFSIYTGRMETYENLKGLVENLDLIKSKVLTERVGLKDAISVYEFLKHVSDTTQDSFDVDEYVIGDVDINELESDI